MLLAGIVAISLLVGGIGVMNIMLVSVTERIREIGLRKALGATPSVITTTVPGRGVDAWLGGGIAGAALGVVGAVVIPHFITNKIAISVPATVGALVCAIGIGVVFGVTRLPVRPAWRQSKRSAASNKPYEEERNRRNYPRE